MKYQFSTAHKKGGDDAYNVHFVQDVKGIDKSNFSADVKKALQIQANKNNFEGKSGQLVSFDVLAAKQVNTFIAAGLSDSKDQEVMRRASAAVSRAIRSDKTKKYSIRVTFGFSVTEEHLTSLVEGFMLTAYSFDKYRRETALPNTVVDVIVESNLKEKFAAEALHRGQTLANAVYLAKDLINESPSVLYPESFGGIIKKEFKSTKFQVQVHDVSWLKKNGMGGILAVGQGSVKKPVLIEVSYRPARARKHVVLVGKGVTFDSGGLSLKVGGIMVSMKADMGGAAAIVGALKIIAAQQPNVQVTALIPSVENMPDGNSYRVDDILNMADGSTVEVNNTDAEGRLILADALYYASQKKPDCILDVATLTGAMGVALGNWTAGLFSNNDKVATGLLESSKTTGEKLWRMPLDQDLKELLKSPVADQKNTGGPAGGSITAALFLESFVKETPWAHLDIASVLKSPDKHLYDGNAVGFGVRLLADYVANFK